MGPSVSVYGHCGAGQIWIVEVVVRPTLHESRVEGIVVGRGVCRPMRDSNASQAAGLGVVGAETFPIVRRAGQIPVPIDAIHRRFSTMAEIVQIHRSFVVEAHCGERALRRDLRKRRSVDEERARTGHPGCANNWDEIVISELSRHSTTLKSIAPPETLSTSSSYSCASTRGSFQLNTCQSFLLPSVGMVGSKFRTNTLTRFV